MKMNTVLADRIKIGMVMAGLALLTGCVGWMDGDGYYGSGLVVEPDLYLFGSGYYGRGYDYHGYSNRGFQSRGAAHVGGGAHGGGGHSSGGRK